MDAMLTVEEQARLGKKMSETAHTYRNEPRFRAMVDFAVAEAHLQHGRIDPERPERDAHDMATLAVCLVLARVYTDDIELKTLKWERDHYKKLVGESLMALPLRQFIVSSPATA